MKAVWYVLLSVILYGIGNVIMEQRLSKFNNLTIMVCYSTTILVASLISRQILKVDTTSAPLTISWDFAFVIGLALIWFVADYFYIGAYTIAKGDLFTVSSFAILVPVVASTIKLMLTKSYPSSRQVFGYALIAIGVLIFSKGK